MIRRLARARALALLGPLLAAGCGGGSSRTAPPASDWGPAVTLVSSPDRIGGADLVSVGARGALAVWSQPLGHGRGAIRFSERGPDGRWSKPGNVVAPIPSPLTAFTPRLVGDRRGDALAVWPLYNRSNAIVLASVRPAGGRWSSPVALSHVVNGPPSIDLAMNARGQAVVAWTAHPPGSAVSLVQAALRDADGTLHDPTTLAVLSTLEPQGVRVAIGPNGDALIGWWSFTENGARRSIVVLERRAGGRWTAPRAISRPGERARDPVFALDARGGALAAWTHLAGGSPAAIAVAEGSSHGQWRRPILLPRDAHFAASPSLAVTPAGAALVSWTSWDARVARVEAAMRPAGGRWSRPARIAGVPTPLAPEAPRGPDRPPRPRPPVSPFIDIQPALAPAGGATIVWQRFAGPQQATIEAATLAAGNWSKPAVLAAPPKGNLAYLPRLARGGDGRVLVLWTLDAGKAGSALQTSSRR